jgi:hypothetical protein
LLGIVAIRLFAVACSCGKLFGQDRHTLNPVAKILIVPDKSFRSSAGRALNI